jgi:hypothetical protein
MSPIGLPPEAALAVRACDSHRVLIDTLKLALRALNTAPRIRVDDTDSYAIAAHIERVIRLAEGEEIPP